MPNKLPIQFNNVTGQLFEISQRGIARTEIIHGDANALLAELVKPLMKKRPIGDDHTFCELQCYCVRRQAESIDRLKYEREKRDVFDLRVRDINTYMKIRHILPPFFASLERFLNDPFTQRQDHFRFFQDRHKFHW